MILSHSRGFFSPANNIIVETYLHLAGSCRASSRRATAGAWSLLVPKIYCVKDGCGCKLTYQFYSNFFISFDVCAYEMWGLVSRIR